MLRTHTCGELKEGDEGKAVILCGWAQSVRKHKGISFIDLRDRYGVTQIVLKSDIDALSESVLRASGTVKKRITENPNLPTGKIEVLADKAEVLSKAEPIPFDITEEVVRADEETRLKFRFLDLRRKKMQSNICLRHHFIKSIRDYMDRQGFYEIETPLLAKSTPEGARDYLVPSRISPGKFYALPQSPQLFKQMLMVSGFDKYFQIARCLRDEDLRADRQPEFTQLDIEMSFVEQEDVFELMEGLVKHAMKKSLDVKVKTPFRRIEYKTAMEKYGSEKPDLRKDKTNPDEFAFCWITDFPLMEYSKEEKKFVSMHHPFTSPRDEDLEMLESNPEKVRSKAYDLALNGSEVAGGSIRIHDIELQKRIFRVLGITDEQAEQKFGFLLNAFRYGAPPHGGIAMGLDRMIAIITKSNSIRETIAFPKNAFGRDVLLDAPSEVSQKQLDELGISLKKE
ncbi:MAG: aspartate--tRNA ligase [archaeon]